MAAAGITMPVSAQDNANFKALFGAWRMVMLEVGHADGVFEAVPYFGQVVFTEGGTMSVQAMNPDVAAPDSRYTINGYEAFYGTVAVNPAEGTFVVTIESSAVHDLIGQCAERAFEVSENQLVIRPTCPDESWRVTYERI